MILVILTLVVAALALLFVFPWVGYPQWLRACAVVRPEPATTGQPVRLSVLIPACNEEAHLEEKLLNTLALDYPSELLEILVYSDGSTDNTVTIARRFADQGVQVLVGETRMGKAHGLNRLVEAASGQVLLPTDTSAMLTPNTARDLVAALGDEAVGVATARYRLRGRSGTEGDYWDFESRIRADESTRGVLISAAGAAYALRAALWAPLPEDTINDDYVTPLRVRLAGSAVVHVPQAVAEDDPTALVRHAYHRWVRIAFGNWQMLWRHREGLLRPGLRLPLWRKLLRTSGPLLLLAMLATVTAAACWETLLIPLAAVGWLTLALVPFLSREAAPTAGPRLWRFARLFLVAQYAYLIGFSRFATGRSRALWKRPEDPLAADRLAPLPWSVQAFKRAVDVSAALVALTLGAPIIIGTALAVRRSSPGPVIYKQRRMRPGPDGAPIEFEMYKFRSMYIDAEARSGPKLATDNDPRITPIGHALRKHRLDELPQFFNILKGDMSLVGPRPERRHFADQLEAKVPGFTDRHMVVKPGLTGWAQVQSGYGDGTERAARAKASHDMAYIAHCYRLDTFVRMEIKIIWATVRVVLTGHGAK